jgi:Fe-S-cluster containining protein
VSELLPILADNAPQNLLCGICPAPGSCCSNFSLYGATDGNELTTWADEGIEAAVAHCEVNNVPFVPDHIDRRFEHEGREYVTWRYSCPKLLANGRCGIYLERPETCRRYLSGKDALCVFGT